jgi:hypothetical protein
VALPPAVAPLARADEMYADGEDVDEFAAGCDRFTS